MSLFCDVWRGFIVKVSLLGRGSKARPYKAKVNHVGITYSDRVCGCARVAVLLSEPFCVIPRSARVAAHPVKTLLHVYSYFCIMNLPVIV